MNLKINFKKPTKKDIDIAVDFLCSGGTIVYPTDTIYGLGCLATAKKAIAKVRKIKKRDRNKPLLVLIGSWKMLDEYFSVSARQKTYLRKIWPGPVSAVLNRKKNKFPAELSGGRPSVAVRLPKNDFLIKMIKTAGVPVVSTSLNKSGEPPLENVENVERYFSRHRPDLVLDAGPVTGRPSRLIDLRDVDNIAILRK